MSNNQFTSHLTNSIIFLFVIGSALFSLSAKSQDRHIHINGQHLDAQVIADLDQLVGQPVGDGYYWLNMQTGEWGYEDNNQTQGVISAIANSNANAQENNSPNSQPYRNYEGVSSTGTVTSGRLNGKNCTFVSVGGTTMKSCD
ncbi:MAG: hypothetical protein KUG78_15745 [Kangiellaceae bacterium]|nr:hypothetical protein [Kangiellaceae bacterium]